jgi:hypothetical protein
MSTVQEPSFRQGLGEQGLTEILRLIDWLVFYACTVDIYGEAVCTCNGEWTGCDCSSK